MKEKEYTFQMSVYKIIEYFVSNLGYVRKYIKDINNNINNIS